MLKQIFAFSDPRDFNNAQQIIEELEDDSKSSSSSSSDNRHKTNQLKSQLRLSYMKKKSRKSVKSDDSNAPEEVRLALKQAVQAKREIKEDILDYLDNLRGMMNELESLRG